MAGVVNIAVVVGSIRRESLNLRFAHALTRLAPPAWTFTFVKIDDLPLYNADDDAKPSAATERLKGQLDAAHGVIFVTPEFNRSIPGALKNAIDHGSRPYGKNSWANKPTGIVGVSPGAMGTAMAQQHLRNILVCGACGSAVLRVVNQRDYSVLQKLASHDRVVSGVDFAGTLERPHHGAARGVYCCTRGLHRRDRGAERDYTAVHGQVVRVVRGVGQALLELGATRTIVLL